MARTGKTTAMKRFLRTVVLAVGKRVPAVLTAARGAAAYARGLRWRAMWASNRVDSNVAVFQCYGGRG
jgi:hypothetical protein